MRVLFLVLSLCLSWVSSETITRQGYASGSLSLGGCTSPNAADLITYTIGQCYNNTINTGFLSSVKYNDCWGNGVFTMTRYKGSATCGPAFALQVYVGTASIGSTDAASTYCNGNNGGANFNTYTCSAVTAPPVNYGAVLVKAYPIGTPDTGCSGTNTATYAPIGTCTTIPAASGSATALYVMPNCVDGLVTAVSYSTPDCSLTYDSNSGYITSTQTPFNPFNQPGATAANGKLTGAPASACANSTGVHFSFTCVAPTTAPPTTAAPTTAAPTTAAPTDAPTTAAPATDAPTTAAPTTAAPSTDAPTGPTTLAPTGSTTLAPTDATTATPTTAGPTTGAPTTAGPTTGAPTTAGPTTGAPTTAAPTTAAPTTAAPRSSSSSSSSGLGSSFNSSSSSSSSGMQLGNGAAKTGTSSFGLGCAVLVAAIIAARA